MADLNLLQTEIAVILPSKKQATTEIPNLKRNRLLVQQLVQ